MNKATLTSLGSPKSVTTLIGAKTISTAIVYKHGSVTVLEILFTDATTAYFKVGIGGQVEIGGSNEMNTGTTVTW